MGQNAVLNLASASKTKRTIHGGAIELNINMGKKLRQRIAVDPKTSNKTAYCPLIRDRC